MAKKIATGGLAASLVFLWMITSPVAVKADTFYNIDRKGLAIKGVDPVAYFTMSRPIKGKKDLSSVYGGATWRFSSLENRDLFQGNPERYVPQYGGYCAYGVAEGGLFDIDPDAWTIYEGKLYLNQSVSVRELWLRDIPGHIRRADLLWPKIKKWR